LGLAGGLAFSSCAAPPPATRASGPVVVVVSIDGLPAWAFEDPKLPAPNLRRLMREGASARGMTVVNPSVTWPNHTTLATGVPPARHGVLFNGRLIREGPGKPVRYQACTREELFTTPTVYDLAHRAGLTTAQVDWIPWQSGGTISWAFNEFPEAAGPVEREMVEAGIVTAQELEEFRRGTVTWRDEVWTKAAVHLLTRHAPNLLLFHLLNLDAVHHQYGPRLADGSKTRAGLTGIALADARIGELLRAVDAAGLRDRATVFVVSDHGFRTAAKNIRPHAALRKSGMLSVEGGKVVSCEAHGISEGGTFMLYVTDPARREAVLPRLREIFGSMEGIERIVEPSEFAALGYPPAGTGAMADLVLAAKPGYAFSPLPEGEPVVDPPAGASLGHHGYLSTDRDMDATFVAWGRGIRAGVTVDRVANVDVAPTVAALLGLRMENVTGRVLHEILR
jgi:predicted AlkP superfamily pyrophosphatase or phosphodiesterase